jgi:hypothetical protein
MSTAAAAMVTEEDLLKSIKDLETKPPVAPPATTAPTVQIIDLKKSMDVVKSGATEPLRKGLEVSEMLSEVVTLLGAHIDSSLEVLAKSIQGGAERDLSFIRVITDLKKSIDDNTAAVEKLGQGTVAAPKTVTATTADVLNKSLTPSNILTADQMSPDQKLAVRRQIGTALEDLAKSFPPNDQQGARFMQAAIKYESTGQISDADLRAAQNKIAGK